MSIEENKAIVHQYVDEVFNRGDWSALDEIMAPYYIDHVAFHSQQSSREAFKQTFTAFRAAFPNGWVKAEDVIAEGDRVVWRWSWLGTHQGEFRGIAPTSKQITWTGIIIWRIVDGQIVEWWAENDGLSFMRQLGAIPGPDGSHTEQGGNTSGKDQQDQT